jgi:hypothetical protein
MSERHSVEFDRVGFNVISDDVSRTLTLQFDAAHPSLEPMQRILFAIRQKYGEGITSWLRRWRTGETNKLVPSARSKPHQTNPDVHCFDIGVKEGEAVEVALEGLLSFLQQLPGYRRTIGAPLNRDDPPSRPKSPSPRDASSVAQATLRQFFERRAESSGKQPRS